MNRHLRQKCKKREMYTNDQPAETTFEIQAESSEIELGNHSLSFDFFPLISS